MVSVIIPNMNGRRYLGDCLGSLGRQSYKDFEVIMVDNGSKDGSREFVEGSFPSVRVVSFPQPLGFSRAVNAGIKVSRGEYIALLNTDTLLEPGWLEALVKALESSPEAGLCASRILRWDSADIIDSAGDGIGVNGLGYNIGAGERNNGRFNYSREVFGACAAAAIYRRKMFDEVGLFDEDFHSIFEDTDISFRARLNAYQCIYAPDALLWHRRFGTIGTLSEFAVYYSSVNSLNLIVKNMPFKLIIKYYPQIIFGQYVKSIELLSGQGQGLALLKGRLAALRQLMKMLAKRRAIQAQRKAAVSVLEKNFSPGRKRDLLPLVVSHLNGFNLRSILFGVLSAAEASFILIVIAYHDFLNSSLVRTLMFNRLACFRVADGLFRFMGRIGKSIYSAALALIISAFTLIFMALVLSGIMASDILQYFFNLKGVFKEGLPKKDYQKGLVSVVILNWNGRRFLKNLFNSLRNQSVTHFEVIMVDNGSSDGSQAFIRDNSPEVKVIENKTNLGFAKGINTGIRYSAGEYIAILNNDTYLDKNWLREVLKGLDENPDVGIFGSKIYLDGLGNTFDVVAQGIKPNGRTENIGAGCADNGQFDQLKEVFGVSACAAIYRRSVLEDIGIFDEDFFNSYEDNDLHFRAQILGHKCRFLKDALVYHKGTATIKVGSAFHVYYLCKNSAHPMIKNMPSGIILRNLLSVLVGPIPEFVFFAVKWQQPKTVISGMLNALRDLPLMLSKRHHLNNRRRFMEHIDMQ